MTYHVPVLLNECMEGLAIQPNGVYVDLTFGGGGHSIELLSRLDQGRLVAFDQDEDAFRNKPDDDRLTLVKSNFKYLKNFLQLYNALPADGILADLGISSHQIDVPERGFSTRFDGDIDMRMDQSSELTAKLILNTYSDHEIMRILREYGEIKSAYKLAQAIVQARSEKSIDTIAQLKEILFPFLPKHREFKFLAQVFQALRIEVNDELGALKAALIQCKESLKPGGRLVVMSYHSLEDRLVKNFLKSGNFEGKIEKDFYGQPQVDFKLITRKPIVANEAEIERNPRARSAKLRIAEKL